MYACGYLVSRGHLNSLGLYGVIEETTDSLSAGGREILLRHELPHHPLDHGCSADSAHRYPHRLCHLLGQPTSECLRMMTRLIPSRVREKLTPTFRRRALYALAVGALIWLVNRFLDDAQAPALVSNLLFASGPVTSGARKLPGLGVLADSIKQALLHGDDSYVDTIYGLLVFGAVASALRRLRCGALHCCFDIACSRVRPSW